MELLYLYITTYTAYFLYLTAMSMKSQRKVRDKFTSKNSNICVVVYASGNSDTLENLIKQLKNQDYPKQNYVIYAILDKCENVSEVTLQSDLNVNVISINNLEPVGKSQAYSIIAEKMQDVNGLDAYVFLDSKNYVDKDFLLNVNYYLTKYDVLSPMINYLPKTDTFTFWENVKSAYSLYTSKFINKSRTLAGLTNILNTDSFVIKKDLFNKMSLFDFRDMIAELNYTLKLANEGVIVAFIEDLKVYTSIENFDFRVPSLSKRLGIFFSNVLKKQSWRSLELCCSMTSPNWLVCALIYFLLLAHLSMFPMFMLSWVSFSTLLITAIVFVIAFCLSLLNSKLYTKEYLYILAYPICSIGKMIYNFPPIRGIRNIIKTTTRKHVIEKMVTNVIVSDGVKDFQCKLELISDDGLARVKFINNGKTYTTKNNHLRMIDAVREISSKLTDYGMTLKVCQCCKYFQPTVDGSTNMVKGTCQCNFPGRTPGDMIPTLLWNTCPKFEEHNVINLF